MNSFAISSKGVGDALQRSAAALAAAGNDINESIGMVTAMNTILQNPDAVGTTLKTLTMYLRSAKEDAEAAGIETDGMAESVSKLRDKILSLSGVDIMLNKDTFKSTFQIVKELSEVWDRMTDINRASVLELVGGKRNANAVSALIQNFDLAINAADTAQGAMGSAYAENEKYLDSINGKIATATASFQEMSNTLIDSGIAKYALDVASGTMKIVTGLGKINALLPSIVAAATLIYQASSNKKSENAFDALRGMLTAKDLIGHANIESGVMDAIGNLTGAQREYVKSLIEKEAATKLATEAGKGNAEVIVDTISKMEKGSDAVKGMGFSIKSLIKSMSGVTKTILIVNAALGIGKTIWDWYKNSIQDQIDRADELIAEYNDAARSYQKNTEAISQLGDEYRALSKGVSENGENVSLTASEYERYKSVVSQIAGISPEVVKGYDSERGMVIVYTDAIDKAIASQKEMLDNQKEIYLNSGKELFGGKRHAYKDYIDDIERAGFKVGAILNYDDIAAKALKEAKLGNLFTKDERSNSTSVSAEQMRELFENRKLVQASLEKAYSDAGYNHEQIISYTRDIMSSIYGVQGAYEGANAIIQEESKYIETYLSENYPDKLNALSSSMKDSLIGGIDSIVDPNKNDVENLAAATGYLDEFFAIANGETASGVNNLYAQLAQGTIGLEDYNKGIADIIDGLDGTGPAFDAARSAVSTWAYGLTDNLTRVSSAIRGYKEEVAKVPNGFKDVYKQMTEDAKIRNAALIDMMRDGTLSAGTLDSIYGSMGKDEDVSQYLSISEETGALELNVAAWDARANAMAQSDISVMEGQIARLEAENKMLDAIREGEEAMAEYMRSAWSGNVDLLNRPATPSSMLSQAGWEASGADSTIFSATYTAGDMNADDGYDFEYDRSVLLNFTPIIVGEDGNTEDVLSPESMRDYVQGVIDEASRNGGDFKAADTKKLLINTALIGGEETLAQSLDKNGESMDRLRRIQDAYYTDSANNSAEAANQITRNNETIAETYAQLALYQASFERAQSSIEGRAGIDTTLAALDAVAKETDGLRSAIHTLETSTDGAKLSYAELAGLAQAYPGLNLGDMLGAEDANAQLEMLKSIETEYNDVLQGVIDRQIDMLNQDMAKEGADTEAIESAIAVLNTLRGMNLEDLYPTDEAKAYEKENAKVVAALGKLKKGYELIATLREDAKDGMISPESISAAMDYDPENWQSFFNADMTGANIDVLTASVESYTAEVRDAGIITETYNGALESMKASASETTSAFSSLSDAIVGISSGQGVIASIRGEIAANGKNSTDTWKSVIDMMGEEAASAMQIVDGALKIDADIVETWLFKRLDDMENVDDEMKQLIRTTSKEEAAFESLLETMGGLSGAGNLFSTISSELSKMGTNSLDTLMDYMNYMGPDWADPGNISWTDYGPVINTDSVYSKIVAQIDAATVGHEEYGAALKRYLSVAYEENKVNQEIADSYAKAKSAVSSYTGGMEITYDAYKSLIEIDAQYADAIEYQNGRMVLNAEKYNAITRAVVENTKAQALEQAQLIATSDEYLTLQQNAENLSEQDMRRYNELSAKIMGYRVLAQEIDGSTAALQRFNAASKDPESEGYKGLKGMVDVVDDVLYNKNSDLHGHYGNEAFTEARRILFTPEIEVDSPEFKKQLKTLKKYVTEDGNLGMNRFYKDLLKTGVMNEETKTIDPIEVGEAAEKMGVTVQAFRWLVDQLNEHQFEEDKIKIEASVEGSEESQKDLNDLKTSSEEAKTPIQALSDTLDGIIEKNNTINATTLSIQTGTIPDALGKVSVSLQNIIDKLAKIAGIGTVHAGVEVTQTVTTKTQTEGTERPPLFSGGSSGVVAANGTSRSAGGRTLVGELGPEAVVDPAKNEWYTVGVHGPEFVTLPKNAIVFSASQTSDLLSSGYTAQRGTALASGNNDITSSGGGGLREPIYIPPNSSYKKDKDKKAEKEMNELEKLEKEYKDINDQLEHLIEHQEFLYRQSERGLNFDGMEQSLVQQTHIYRKMMENCQEAIDAMIAKGATDADEELQNMERAYWSAYNDLYDTLDEINALYIDGLNKKIDSLQDAYKNLADAADEFAENGGISIDTFQALIANGVQYLSLLDRVGGAYVINEDGIRRMINAEKDQMAVESAMSYISQVRQALEDKQADKLANLVDLTNEIGNSTWTAVYAQAALLKGMGLSDAQYDRVIENIDALRTIAASTIDDVTERANNASSSIKKGHSEELDALDEILDKTQDLVKYETNQRIDAIKDEIDAYKELIDAKKESLQASRDEGKYTATVAEKTAEIARIQAQIEQLALDDSRQAQAERAALAEKLAGLQNDLAETQSDHAYDSQVDALDKAAEEYEAKRQEEIDALEDSISSAEKLYQLSIERLQNGWSTLYDELIAWNTEAGSSLNKEITENWQKAAEAVKEYGSYTDALDALTTKKDKDGNNIIVADKNKLPHFHSGGVVGGDSPMNGKEALAVLQEGEVVLDHNGQKTLFKMIDFNRTLSDYLGSALQSLSIDNLLGKFGRKQPDTAGPVQNTANTHSVFSPVFHVAVSAQGGMTEMEASRIGNKIAGAAAEKLYDAFSRRGVSGRKSSRLRQ